MINNAIVQKGDLIRILCVFSTLDRGGAESMCMNLYRHIDREKVQFDFVKHTPDKGAFEDEILSLGGRIFEAPRYQIYNHMSYMNWWDRFLKAHPEHQIIHGHFFTISSVFFAAAHKAGRITIGHSHCTKSPKQGTARPIVNYLSNRMISHIEKNADYCLACSEAAGKWVFKEKPFTVLKNAIDVTRFRTDQKTAQEVRNEFGLGNNLVVGNVSRFNLQKNPYGTLDIFRLVHEKRPDSKLLWVGDGPMRAEVQAKAQEYGIQDDVIFTGVRKDIHRLLQAMDAFILPSFYEGLPVVAIEAQAAGVKTFCSTEISFETGITDLCKFLSLNDLQIWADDISQIPAAYEHLDITDEIIHSGYDIHTTAAWLQDFYLKLAGRSEE